MVASWRRHIGTARAKATIAATGVVAVALIVAGLSAVMLQRASLVDAIDTALIARVDDLGALIVDGSIPTQLTVPGDEAALVQVIDGDGTVIASSPNIAGEDPIAEIRPSPGNYVIANEFLPVGEEEFRLVASTVTAHDQQFTIYAAASLQPAATAVATLSMILIIGIPILILLVGVTVWLIVGRTLHPIEAIRVEVASISDRELSRRVPVPDADDEIARLASTMNDMLDRLEQSSDQQRRFIADASHELRSPLAAIRTQLEVDLAHPEQADWESANAEVLDEALRMQRLVDDLLLLARSDTGTLPAVSARVDMDDVLFEQIRRMQLPDHLELDTKNVSGGQVSGDSETLGRVVRNLLENATRYANRLVQVSLGEDDGLVVLTIADDGPGIPPGARQRVFDRFTRLDEARDRDHGGAGLGLAISQEIAQHHNGTIILDESSLGGTKATLRLPTSVEPRE